MSVSEEFLERLRDLFAAFGPVQHRRMFGGVGLFRDGLMFALVADNVLYFKVGEGNRADYDDAGMPPFQFETRTGRRTVMSYHEVPGELFDEPEAFAGWARKAYEAALVADAAKPRRRR